MTCLGPFVSVLAWQQLVAVAVVLLVLRLLLVALLLVLSPGQVLLRPQRGLASRFAIDLGKFQIWYCRRRGVLPPGVPELAD